MPYMETTSHHRRADIAVEKRSPFRPHRGLAAPDLFLDTMLNQRTWEHARLTVLKPCATYTGTDPKHVARRVNLTEMLSWESLFILSRLSTCRSTKSSAGVNPQGRNAKKVKLLLKNSHLEPQAVRSQCLRGDDDLE
jgi:hypothetical protein